MRIANVLFAVLLSGCALISGALPPPEYGYANFEDVPSATCSKHFSDTFEGSEFTDPAEQAALKGAADAWRTLSKGQIDFTISFDATTPNAKHFHRVKSDDKIVLDYEARQEKQPFIVFGWHDASGDIYLVVNDVPLEQLHTLVAHELGHAAGMRWPLCLQSHSDCIHSPDPHAVMAPEFSGAPALTPSDLALCRASCLCP